MNLTTVKDFIAQLKPTRRREALILISVAILYLILWLFVPKPSFWGIDNGIKFQGARAFAASGEVGIPYSSQDFDPQGDFRPIVKPFGKMRENKQLPVFSVLFMMLSGVFHLIFGKIGPFILPLLGGWGCLLAGWYMWVRFRPNYDGRLFLIMLGLGSPLLFYSMTLWEHSLAMALITLSFAFLIHNQSLPVTQSPRAWEVTFAGFLIGIATMFRTEAVFWVVPPIFFWRSTERNMQDIGRFITGFLAGLAALVFINQWQTGELIPLHVDSNIKANKVFGYGYSYLLKTRIDNLFIITVQGFSQKYKSLFLLLPLVIAAVWRGWRHEKDWGYYLAAGILAVWGIYFYNLVDAGDQASFAMNSGGLLWIVPFVILAILPSKSRRIGRFWKIIWLSPIIYLVLVSAGTPTVRGVHWGPRFVLQALPLMLIVGSVKAQRWWNRYSITKPVIVILILITVCNQFYSYNILVKTRRTNTELNRWAASTGSEPALTNMWWLPGDVSLLSDRFPWYLTDTNGRIEVVVKALREKGVERFNFYERPPYTDDQFWWKIGAEPLGQDYFLSDDGKLRRKWLKILR